MIISPTSDERTTKALLAVSAIIGEKDGGNANVGAIISKEDYRFPPSMAERHNVTTLQTDDTLARIIAHSCTQPGLSETFKEVFNFEGSEMYCIDLPGAEGKSFAELTMSLDGGVPLGYSRGGEIKMAPGPDAVFEEGDKLLVFAEENDTSRLVPAPELPAQETESDVRLEVKEPGRVVIIGCNETVGTILRELPEDVREVLIAGRCDKDAVRGSVADRELEISLTDKATDFIVDQAYDPVYGARPLKRKLQTAVEDKVAEKYLSGEIHSGDSVSIGASNNELKYTIKK